MNKLVLFALIFLFSLTPVFAAPTLAQVLNATDLTSYTPYCDQCRFCLSINKTKLNIVTFINSSINKSWVYNNYITKEVYTNLTIAILTSETTSKATVCAYWRRDRPDIIDVIPTLFGFNITKWATWSPTNVNFTYPLNSSLISGTTFVNATVNNSALLNVSYRMEWYNSTPVFAWAEMTNTSATSYYGSFNTALYNDGGYILRLNIKGKVLYETNITGANTQTAGADSNCWRGQQFTVGSSGTNESFDVYSVEVEMYRSGTPGTCVLEIYNVDGSGYPTGTPISSGSFNASILSEVTGNLYNVIVSNTTLFSGTQYGFMVRCLNPPADTYVWLRGISSQTYYGGDMLYTQNNGSTFGTTANWDVRFNIYGQNYNTTLTSNITILQSPDIPTCDVANIDNDYWHWNITKHLNADPALSISGCIRSDGWDNGTFVNQSWGTTTNDWYNKTDIDVLQFVGTHYIKVYCNDTLNIWVACALDSYTISSGGGLTTEEHGWLEDLYERTTSAGVILGFALAAFVCFYIAFGLPQSKEGDGFDIIKPIFHLFVIMGIVFIGFTTGTISRVWAAESIGPANLGDYATLIIAVFTFVYLTIQILFTFVGWVTGIYAAYRNRRAGQIFGGEV